MKFINKLLFLTSMILLCGASWAADECRVGYIPPNMAMFGCNYLVPDIQKPVTCTVKVNKNLPDQPDEFRALWVTPWGDDPSCIKEPQKPGSTVQKSIPKDTCIQYCPSSNPQCQPVGWGFNIGVGSVYVGKDWDQDAMIITCENAILVKKDIRTK